MQVQEHTAQSSQSPQGVVSLVYLKSGIAVIALGQADERAVTLTEKRLTSFEQALNQLKETPPQGLVITGASEQMFTVGADIKVIAGVTVPAVGESLARRGQEIFNTLEQLPFPTVAAISGPCVGGGCELVLACKYRILSDSESSRIGLPEIRLGIVPGFGGTQRLPRLIGLPAALEIITAGKILRAKQALRRGVVDQVVPYKELLARAEEIALSKHSVKRQSIKLLDKFLTFTGFGREQVRKRAAAQIAKQTRGFYPAPAEALRVAILGLERGVAAGLSEEAIVIGKLIASPECKALVRLFFLTEGAKGIGRAARGDVERVHAIVVGAGVMGAGIAEVLAQNQCQVILKDSSAESLQRGVAQITKGLEKLKYLSPSERSFIFNRIEATIGESANIGNANLVIEAVFESLELKKQILGDLAKIVVEDAILATNTSSLSVTEIAAQIPNPGRVIGMHFFNPVEKMPLVEIVCGEATSDRAIAFTAALASKLGKHPIVVRDVPGFLVNRILLPYLNEAAQLLNDGYSIEDIDNAALGFGMPMGPIRLLDEVGLDVAAHVAKILADGYGERMRGLGYADRLLAAGRKGKKSGAGFYSYQDQLQRPDPEIRALLSLPAKTKEISDLSYLQDRMIFSLINEAVRCLDEGVAGNPSPEAANQIDLGLVMGAGFPPFRGGILYYADQLGVPEVTKKLQHLVKECGPRFTPWEGILKRSFINKGFREAI